MTNPALLPRPDFRWKLGAPETKFENSWMRVESIPAVDPSGQDTKYGVVRFKNLAVGVVPYADGHIWLVGQSRVTFEAYSWEIPAGGGALDEDPRHAALRELKEETGYTAGTLEKILTMELSNSITNERCVVFLATDLIAGESATESSEDISLLKISLDDAIAAVDAGEIRQSLSVAAILKLARMRSEGNLT
jgi:8-oxo-dGTP pyrophosphatase MutT (NUDIX family)